MDDDPLKSMGFYLKKTGHIKSDFKILIQVPDISSQGGIANYYKVLLGKFNLNVKYIVRGSRNWPNRENVILSSLRIFKDLTCFVRELLKGGYHLTVLNTNIDTSSLFREGIYLFIVRLFRLRVIVFFRGWDDEIAEQISDKWLRIFKFVFFRADALIVLAGAFSNSLRQWGFKKRIFIETTIVEEELLRGFDIDSRIAKFELKKKHYKILFLSRVETRKGIYECLETYKQLKNIYSDLSLSIAGDGSELNKVIETVKSEQIPDVHFMGYVQGENKINAFRDSDIYFFPSYTEGLPNSVLEAMAFGLPIIASAVGGLKDILKDGITGYSSEDISSTEFVNLFNKLLSQPDDLVRISKHNYEYAKANFYTQKVVERLESTFLEVIKN